MSMFRVKRKRLSFQTVGVSALHCCVPLCTASSRYSLNISLHAFPVDTSVRAQWLKNIRRDNFTPTNGTRVCSRHFPPGNIVATPGGLRRLKRGSVPLLFHWNNYSLQGLRVDSPAEDTVHQDTSAECTGTVHQDTSAECTGTVHQDTSAECTGTVHQDTSAECTGTVPQDTSGVKLSAADHDYTKSQTTGRNDNETEHESLREHGTLPQEHGTLLREERGTLLREERGLLGLDSRFCLERFAASDEDIRFYTRFASYRHFQHFWRLIEPTVRTKMIRVLNTKPSASGDSHTSRTLPLVDELFMFLMYLSVGLLPQDLAARFGVHCSTVSSIITTWTSFLYQLLGSKRLWLPREVVRTLLPPEFAAFSDTHVVLDFIEIYCQTSSDLLIQSDLCSTHFSHSTLKAMIGMAPHGAITFVSALYPGSTSEREIFRQSGIISVLQPDEAVMVDKGFLIDDVAPCKVYRPAYFSGTAHMSRQDLLQTQSVARLKVHVEHCLRRVKENKLFDGLVPVSVCGSIHQLFNVACYLVNYQNGPQRRAHS